ncbi:hypothetical protein NTJ12_002275 [Flavobacterium psychrophilum]|nr:hypothetical protein [Flavobacterium psychrophilum]
MGVINIFANNFIENASGSIVEDGGEIVNLSEAKVVQNGAKGVDYDKNKDRKPPTDIRITKVEGPFDDKGKIVDKIVLGTFYVYKATTSRKPTVTEIGLLKWSVKFDNGERLIINGVASLNKLDGDKIIIQLVLKHDFEKARIYAFYQKAEDGVSVILSKNPTLLQNIIIIGTQNHRGDTSFTNPLSWIRDVGPGSKLMFAHQAIRRIKMNKDIKFSVLMCSEGYSPLQIKAVKDAIINLYGGKFYEVSNAQQIINYINTGDKNNSSTITDTRKCTPIKQLFFYSHGLVGKIALGMGLTGDNSQYSFVWAIN